MADKDKADKTKELSEEVVSEQEAKAIARFIRVSPYKTREVVDLIRGKDVEEASTILAFSPKAAAKKVNKVLDSAVANAEKNFNMKRESLFVARVFVDEGPSFKRFRPRSMGRVNMIKHKTSHITVVVEERKGK